MEFPFFVKDELTAMYNTSPCERLLYKATVDGWNVTDFHRLCDSKGPTVTLIQTTTGRICGGFT